MWAHPCTRDIVEVVDTSGVECDIAAVFVPEPCDNGVVVKEDVPVGDNCPRTTLLDVSIPLGVVPDDKYPVPQLCRYVGNDDRLDRSFNFINPSLQITIFEGEWQKGEY